MKSKPVKKLTGLELSEETTLCARLLDTIEVGFCHVEFPAAITKAIRDRYSKLCQEADDRVYSTN